MSLQFRECTCGSRPFIASSECCPGGGTRPAAAFGAAAPLFTHFSETCGAPLTADETFLVQPVPGTVALGGSVLSARREAAIVDQHAYTLTLRLADDYWAPALATAYNGTAPRRTL